MLSITPDSTADAHITRIVVGASTPPVRLVIVSATAPISPISMTPATSMKSPMKKKSVGHSTSRRISCGSSRATIIRGDCAGQGNRGGLEMEDPMEHEPDQCQPEHEHRDAGEAAGP